MKWSEMTAAERSAEMTRRQAVAKAKRNGEKPKRKYTRRNGSKKADDNHSQDHEVEKAAWYLFGKVETIIDIYSASSGIPRAALTAGLARLLRH